MLRHVHNVVSADSLQGLVCGGAWKLITGIDYGDRLTRHICTMYSSNTTNTLQARKGIQKYAGPENTAVELALYRLASCVAVRFVGRQR